MRSSAELICVDPARVAEIWPLVEEMILSAVRRVNLSHPQSVRDSILSGGALLWIVWDGKKILAAGSTEIVKTENDKFCILTACGGTGLREWRPLLGKIDEYAKAEGCKALRIFGREGWLRALDGYRKTAVVLEKDLG